MSTSWECVHFADATYAPTLRDRLAEADFYLAAMTSSDFESDGHVLQGLAREFHFPSYFGVNWDAAMDCLADLEWVQRDKFALVVEEADAVPLHGLGSLIELWLAAAQVWSERGAPFHLLVVTGAGGATAPLEGAFANRSV